MKSNKSGMAPIISTGLLSSWMVREKCGELFINCRNNRAYLAENIPTMHKYLLSEVKKQKAVCAGFAWFSDN